MFHIVLDKFRKLKDGRFICEECGVLCSGIKGLSIHVGKIHDDKKYYDKWIKYNDKCKICGNQTKFLSLARGYKDTCSRECSNIYGVKQSIKGNLKKYGVKRPLQVEKFKDKKNKTCLRLYGVEHSLQNKEIFEDHQKNSTLVKQYKNTNIYYQGSYELDFLEKYYEKIDIERGPTVSYLFEGNDKIYYSDFYIPSKNLVVEIKNSYLFKRDNEKIKEKEKATISNGYKYIMILDKNYIEFNNVKNNKINKKK